MSTEWQIRPSYKFDLASICNLFTGRENYKKLHKEGWEKFQNLFTESKEHIKVAEMLNKQGFLVSSALIAIFDSYEYNGQDIQEICRIAEESELRETVLRSYFVDNKILSPEQWKEYSPILPELTSMARYVHQAGFKEYWLEHCQPEIEQRCEEYLSEARKYPILQAVNRLLGEKYARNGEHIFLYPCKFAAPYGSSLAHQGFVSDIRWGMETTVAIALHELMHPPFSRDKLKRIAEELIEDDLVIEARELLPPYYYPTPVFFIEENIVEGAHIYLAEKMGVEKNPLEYFLKHDKGSHVLSVIIYEALKGGMADEGHTIEEVVEDLMAKGVLQPGAIKDRYCQIYEKAGLLDKVPFD